MATMLRWLSILRKNWKLAAIAIVSLSVAMAIGVISLGISGTALLVPPAGEQPNRLITIYEQATGKGLDHVSYPGFEYYRDNNHRLRVGRCPGRGNLRTPNDIRFAQPDPKTALVVTSNPGSENYFSVLGPVNSFGATPIMENPPISFRTMSRSDSSRFQHE